MRPRKYVVLMVAFVACLAFDAWVYASLAREPGVGPPLAAAARANAPLLHTYMVAGRPLVAMVGTRAGQRVADAAFASAYPAIKALPGAADSLLFSQSAGKLRALLVLLYWATPVLLLLALLAWLLRSRKVHLVGRGRR